MSSSQKLLNGLSELGIQKMQEHLDYYIELVNKGDKSFGEALGQQAGILGNSVADAVHIDCCIIPQLYP